jgi:hypothetical protein
MLFCSTQDLINNVMQNNISKNQKATNALIKQIKGNKKQSLISKLSTFFDAASFKDYEETLGSLIQTYIMAEEGGTIQVADMVHQVRLITNLLHDLSQYHDQKALLSTLKDLKGGVSC